MSDDGWTSAASTDTLLVANLLVRLKQSTPTITDMNKLSAAASFGGLVPFRWGRRKARSTPDVTNFGLAKEYKERSARSPTTPLSWSGGCGTASGSGSGNVEGCEASCRSKITAAYELTSGKKAKRKKTYNELKKEECLLLDERLNLQRDLTTVHATLSHHKMANQNLKRIKGMNVHPRSMSMAVAEHPFVCVPKQTIAATIQGQGHTVTFKAQDSNNPSQPYFSSENFLEPKDKQSFSLPDLNMLPSVD